ncbi:MAG: c-type cytochrome [Acidobacteria bacterium]|nr:c-type cytochrome [Acidobacteriota bacterium]
MNRATVLASATLLLMGGARAASADANADIERGRQLVEARCAACHDLAPSGAVSVLDRFDSDGPVLYYAGSKFRPGWLEAWLKAPERIRPAGYLPFRYTVATEDGDRIDETLIPEHLRLSPEEAHEAAAFLATLVQPVNPYPTTEAKASLRPAVHFEKILPCGACHQDRPGVGGLSGPELYRARERLERSWTLAFVEDPPYWGPKPMPKVNVRGDLLTALGDFLFSDEEATTGEAPQLGSLALTGDGAPRQAADPGERIYLMLCSQCHGVSGNGRGINSASMFIAPRNHTSFEEMAVLSDDHLFSTIKRGGTSVGKSALMPAWGGVLSDDEIHLVMTHLRRLSGTGS